MRDKIVDEVRKIRQTIESEQNADWLQLEKYFIELQKRHLKKLYKGLPKSLPVRDVV